jgi:hypothetical protein
LSNCSRPQKLIGQLTLNNDKTLDVRRDDFYTLCDSSEDLDREYKISSGSFTKRKITRFKFYEDVPNDFETISSNFLYGCQFLNSPIVLPFSVTHIENNFLGKCTRFNSDVDLNNVYQIGSNFMYGD